MAQLTIAQIGKDERFEGYLMVRSSEQRTAASGKMYLDLTLADKTGSINAKMWDGTVVPPSQSSVVHVRATGNEFNGRMQLRIERIRAITPGEEIDMSVLVPCAPYSAESMYGELTDTIANVADDEIRAITQYLIDQAGERLMTFPAAKQMHHAQRSGLLYHVTTMLKTAKAIAAVYPYLNKDLLYCGVIIHDLAKLTEMDADTMGVVRDYTTQGKLIGHLVRGVVDIHIAGKKVGASEEKVLLLEHMVLSHHGTPEFGSPVSPRFPEAEVLHTIDTLDARLFEMQEALRRTVPGGFSEKVWAMENRQLYRIPDAIVDED